MAKKRNALPTRRAERAAVVSAGMAADFTQDRLLQQLTSMTEPEGVPSAQEMIRLLVQGQEAVVKTARSIAPVADKASDEPTLDLLTQRMQVHEKTAWMLRSLLEA